MIFADEPGIDWSSVNTCLLSIGFLANVLAQVLFHWLRNKNDAVIAAKVAKEVKAEVKSEVKQANAEQARTIIGELKK